jgi:excinuclease ABC subunit B
MKKKSVSSAIKASGGGRSGSKVHKPHLDEMHGPESLPYRPGGATPAKTFVRQRQQNLPANGLAPVRPRVRPRPALQRRRAGASRRVEEAVIDQ